MNIGQADPACGGSAPAGCAHGLLLINLHLGATGKDTDLFVIGSRATAHTQVAGRDDSGCDHIAVAIAICRGNHFIVRILQADPAGGALAPLHILDGNHFGDIQLLAPLYGGQDLAVGTGSTADTKLIHGDRDLYTLLFGFVLFLFHRTHGSLGSSQLDAGIGQINPAAVLQPAPLYAVAVHIVRDNANRCALGDGLGLLAVLSVAGCVEAIENGQLQLCHPLIVTALAQNVAVLVQLALVLLPVGIQGLALGGVIQMGDPLAACGSGVPAQEAVAGVSGSGLNGNGHGSVIALDSGFRGAAVGIEEHICKITGSLLGIVAIQVHIRLCQPAGNKAGKHIGACLAPEGHAVNKVVAGLALNHGSTEIAVRLGPGGSHIIGEQHQGIKLVLGELQLIVGSQLVDAGLHGCQMRPQEGVRLLLGNSAGIVRSLAAGTIADGILPIVLMGLGGETLHVLQNRNCLLTGGKHRCGRCLRDGRNHADQHKRNKQSANNSSLHMYTCSFTKVSLAIL